MSKIKYPEHFTLGQLIDQLTDLAEEHGREVPVGRIGHFGEVHHLDRYSVCFSSELRHKYDTPLGSGWRSGKRRDIPKLVEIEVPDIGPDPC
jgi:hypothetical protein